MSCFICFTLFTIPYWFLTAIMDVSRFRDGEYILEREGIWVKGIMINTFVPGCTTGITGLSLSSFDVPATGDWGLCDLTSPADLEWSPPGSTLCLSKLLFVLSLLKLFILLLISVLRLLLPDCTGVLSTCIVVWLSINISSKSSSFISSS